MAAIDVTRETFNTKQVCGLVPVTVRQVNHWDRAGIVRPSIRPAAGKGSRRLYSYADLLAFKTVKSLRDQGVSLQKVRRCVRYLRRHLPDISQPLTFGALVTDGDTVYLIQDEKTLLDTVKRQGQLALLQLSIAAFDADLRRKVFRLTAKRIEEVPVGDEVYQVEIEPDPDCGGYVASVAGLPGCMTDGDTLTEVLANAVDAIDGWLEGREELARRGVPVPARRTAPRKKARA